MKKIAIALGLASTSIYQVANADLFIDDSSSNLSAVSTNVPVNSSIETVKSSIKEDGVVSTAKNYVIKERKKNISEKSYKDFVPNKNYDSVKENQEKKVKKATRSSINKTTYNGKGELVKGFANNLAIKDVLEQIVPSDWKVEVSDKVNLSQKVSFKGGKPWDSILNEVSYNKFNTYISWSDKKITIKPKIEIQKQTKIKSQIQNQDVVKVAKKESRELKNTTRTRFMYDPSTQSKNVTTVKEQALPIVERNYSSHSTPSNFLVKNHNKDGKVKGIEYAQIKQKTWLLSKKLTLKENIEAWAKKEGWSVAWKAPDYNVIADARFTGELDSEDGPIISILKNYEDSNLPLKINILGGNKVIHVESRNYLPKDVVDLSL